MKQNKLLKGPRKLNATVRELILAHILNITREKLLTLPFEEVPIKKVALYKTLAKRGLKNEPLAYILNHQPFYGLEFTVNKSTLIPRPETEYLVEAGLKILKKNPEIKTVLDVGTGSGCIIISLAKNAPRSDARFYGTDISAKALKVAERNAKNHEAKIIFERANLLNSPNLPPTAYRLPTLMIANLPYLTRRDYDEVSDEVKKEPKQSLVAGNDGLKYYRKLIKQLAKFNCFHYCLWEIDPCHSAKLATLVLQDFPRAEVKIRKDFNKLDRYIEIFKPETKN